MEDIKSFEELKEQFLLANPDYTNDIKNFTRYMRNIIGAKNLDQQLLMVNGIRTEAVIKSLQHYIEKGQIKKQEPAKKYFIAVKQLFEFVLDNSNYQNEDFRRELANPSTREDSYIRKTSIFIADCSMLQPKESFSKLEDDRICKLIEWCDAVIPKDELECTLIDATSFRRAIAALCIKLIMFTGLTYRECRQIMLSALNAKKNTVNINGYTIRLPLTLSVQFQWYGRYREQHMHGTYLFVDANGNQWGEATSDSGIPNYMKTAIETTNITGLVKYGLTQLVKSGINDSVIMQLTGASGGLLDSCLEDIRQDIAKNDPYWNQYINSKLVTTQSYYKL